jgi:hypothetical protein
LSSFFSNVTIFPHFLYHCLCASSHLSMTVSRGEKIPSRSIKCPLFRT